MAIVCYQSIRVQTEADYARINTLQHAMQQNQVVQFDGYSTHIIRIEHTMKENAYTCLIVYRTITDDKSSTDTPINGM